MRDALTKYYQLCSNFREIINSTIGIMSCDYRFDILIRTLYVSKNLIMVYLIVKFLFKFLYSLDDDVIEDVIREFFESRVGERKVEEVMR